MPPDSFKDEPLRWKRKFGNVSTKAISTTMFCMFFSITDHCIIFPQIGPGKRPAHLVVINLLGVSTSFSAVYKCVKMRYGIWKGSLHPSLPLSSVSIFCKHSTASHPLWRYNLFETHFDGLQLHCFLIKIIIISYWALQVPQSNH